MLNKEVICGIYKITSPSGKIYIGQSINIYKRFNDYKRSFAKGQHKLSNSFVKYGINNHQFDIILICEECDLTENERKQMNFYNSQKNGLNIRDAGIKGSQSYETKEKIRKSLTGKKHTNQRRINISNSHKGLLTGEKNNFFGRRLVGDKSPMFGKKASIETRQKQREAKLGTKQSLETIKKKVESRKGYCHSSQTRLKISESKKKNNLLALFEKQKNKYLT